MPAQLPDSQAAISPPRPRSRRAGVETATLYAASIACYADMYLTQPVLPVLSREFGLSPARAGLSVSVVVIGVAAASSFHGALSDVLGRKRVMVGSALLLVVPTLLCAFTRSFDALVALRAVQGLLIPGVTAVSVAYAGDHVDVARLPAVVGALIAASVTGGLTGRVVGGLVASVAGWRAEFALFAAITLAAGLLIAYGLEPGSRAERLGWSRAYGGMLRHLVDRRLLGAFLIGMTLLFAWMGLFTFLPYHLVSPPYRLGTAQVSLMYLVYLAGIAVSPVAGRLAGRISPRLVMGAGLCIAALGMIATLLRPLWAIAAALVVSSVGMFAAQGVAPGFVNRNAASAKGGANALYLMFYYLGGALGSALLGFAWQAWEWGGVVGISALSLLAGLIANLVLCGGPAPTPVRAPRQE